MPCYPILGVRLCAQDGGVLLDFAFPPFFFQNGGRRGFPGGTPGFPFFRHFFVKRQRNGIFAISERAKQCEPGYEGVESLAEPFATSSRVCRRTTRGGKGMFILSRPRKNEPRKRTKGPNALWIPAVRRCRRDKSRSTAQKQTTSDFAFAS